MTAIKRASQKDIDENKRKQQILKKAGYNVNIDGSWGPWQQKLWQKFSNEKLPLPGLKKSNTIALPMTSSTVSSAAGPLGIVATLALPLFDSGVRDQLKLAGNLGRAFIGNTYDKLSSYFYPEEAPAPAVSDGSATGTATQTAPAQQPGRDDSASQRKPSFREKVGDFIAGRGRTTTGGNTPPKPPKPPRGLAPFTGYRNGTLWGNALRLGRDLQTIGTGIDLIDNIAGGIGARVDTTRVSDANWNLTRNYTPLGGLFHLTTKERPAVTRPAVPGDSLPTQQVPVNQDTVRATSSQELPNSDIVEANTDFEEWLKTRETE